MTFVAWVIQKEQTEVGSFEIFFTLIRMLIIFIVC